MSQPVYGRLLAKSLARSPRGSRATGTCKLLHDRCSGILCRVRLDGETNGPGGEWIRMIIGVPREIKNNEFRVALVPAGAEMLVEDGHTVLVEAGAGLGTSIE